MENCLRWTETLADLEELAGGNQRAQKRRLRAMARKPLPSGQGLRAKGLQVSISAEASTL